MVVLGWHLDLMILEVFSNLWFYDFQKEKGLLIRIKKPIVKGQIILFVL